MSTPIHDLIDKQVKENDIILYMKGSKDLPMCGFSARAVNLLKSLGLNNFTTVDVLQDQAIRDGIKQYSEWPTIPQLYVKGEFIGGSDIMAEMYESGELAELIKNVS